MGRVKFSDKIPNYSAQDYPKLKKKDKDKLVKELEKEEITLEDYEAEIKSMWPPEVKLPKAHWRVR